MPRPGTSVSQFFARFPDKDACVQHLFDARWGGGSPCPGCGGSGEWRRVGSSAKFSHSCGFKGSVTHGTVFYRSNLSLIAWFYALLLFCNSSIGVRSAFLRRQLGIGARSTHRLSNAIRYLFAAAERPDQLGGPDRMVHVDEVFLRYFKGADEPNAIVWGCACDGQVLTIIIPDTKRATLTKLVSRFVKAGSTIVTDGHPSYRQLSELGYRHVRLNHRQAFHNFEGVTNNPIERYWAVLRRTMSAYRSISRNNLWLYLAEIEFRYNRRASPTSLFDEMCPRLALPVTRETDLTTSRFVLREA